MGIIYKIQNSVNSKVYIGQTVQTLKSRYNSHVYKALNDANLNPGSLHYDMRQFGIGKFKCEVIERCDNSRLQDREIYYIAKYDSMNSGYNKNSGGQGHLVSSDIIREQIVQLALQGYTPTEISQTVGVQLTLIKRVLRAEEIEANTRYSSGRLAVVKFDGDFNRLGSYDSITEAYRQSNIPVSESTFQHSVRRACGTGEILYNFRWALEEDLLEVVEGKVYKFKSPLDKYNYLHGAEFSIDGEHIVTKNIYRIVEQARCKFCGRLLVESEVCADCASKHPRSRVVIEYLKQHKQQAEDRAVVENKAENEQKSQLKDRLPDKETLEKLMQSYSYKQIAKMYSVHERTLRVQLIEYGIYKEKIARSVDELQAVIDLLTIGRYEACTKNKISTWKLDKLAKKYSIPQWYYDSSKPVMAKCVYTGKEYIFLQLKDAARKIGGDGQQSQQINSLGYRIGKKVESGVEYLGFIWFSVDKDAIKSGIVLKLQNEKLNKKQLT